MRGDRRAEAVEIIAAARSEKRAVLTEYESKKILGSYGVPVVEETVAAGPEAAIRAADRFGYPVAVKGLGERLTHKTDRGLVALDVRSAGDVLSATEKIALAGGADLEGFLVQPMVQGKREFVAGLFRDAQFGPVVMFGLGGIFTEVLNDVVFRLAPLNGNEAWQMIDALRSARLLGSVRGEKAVDRDALAAALMGLSRLAVDFPEVAEVDINPLMADAGGCVRAVDALITIGSREESGTVKEAVDPRAIGRLFYPRSIAFIGASSGFGKWGHMLFTNVVAGGFGGALYLVNAKGGRIAGREVFRTIGEIPGPVDLAVVTIPAAAVSPLIPELRAKGIRNVLLISSGFAETGDEGKRREKELVAAARKAGILILGPNTMGICNPHNKLYCAGAHVRPKPGSTALVSQSGNLGVQLLAFAETEGIGIRAFCGSGNEAMITIEDYLDGFAVDELTRTVVLYIESVKDGRRFYESARKVGRKKPVIVLKGGRTESGYKAAASHTGALASDMRVFEAASRQAGIVMAGQPMELLDLSACFSSLPLPRGNRVAIMTLGGGWGVVTSDLCMEQELDVPSLSEELISRIDRILPPYWSRANPIDLVGEFDPQIPLAILEELLAWEGCDAVLHLGIVGRMVFVQAMVRSIEMADPDLDRGFLRGIPSSILAFERMYNERVVQLMEKQGKPVIGVNLLPDEHSRTVTEIPGHRYRSVSFLTPERAVKSLAKMSEYRRWMESEGKTYSYVWR
ncbi:MAG: Succinyl-CoA ligase (ADP-forming) subunit beta [Syntrophaceae bacterium PtaU1.Bin231]|nr:MAG: Succinyl-CoA ligase (ADP-forming) subunit beta [Syntrophaceae bacterium PtaU1.Bin231]HOG18131.1 acetate--CoA ligase family protein [Syntrophales bacterium]